MVYQKLKKTTTQKQFEIIVDFLQKHNELISSFPASSSAKIRRRHLWNRLTELLNQNGPPTRSCLEWKSIWSDYKYNVKRKLSTDLKLAKRKYASHKRILFSTVEGRVISLLQLKEKLINNQCKTPRGKRGKAKIIVPKDEQQEPTTSADEDDKDEAVVICSDYESVDEKREFVDDYNSTEVHDPSHCDENVLAEEQTMQTIECDVTLMLKDTLRGMQKTQLEILQELKEYNRHKNNSYNFKEQQLYLEREKFEEQKRQNVEANKRAGMELELKRRELELYELKLKGSCTGCVVKTENVEFHVSGL